jgi:predicted phage terminase large subunit-like protein
MENNILTKKEQYQLLKKLASLTTLKSIINAKKDFYTFCQLTSPAYYTKDKQYLKDLCQVLQSFYQNNLINSKTDKAYTGLMIRMPPQTGKSRTLVNFCKWVLGQNQSERIITASYNDDTASTFARFTRDGIREHKNLPEQIVYNDIFPEVHIKSDNASIQNWALDGQHFNYLGVGVGGGVTGKGATIRIIDDLVKDAESALSKNNQDKIWLWLTGTFSSRNSAEGGEVKEIFCATLWTKGDPQYKLLQEERDKWYVYQVEMYNENTGMLCDSVMSYESYISLKNRMLKNELSKLVFWANYHSRIVDIEGALYKGLKTYKELPNSQVKCYIDTADQGNDYLCAVAYKEVNQLRYIVDIYYTQDNADITELKVAKFLKDNDVNLCRVESNAGGMAYGKNVKRITQDIGNYKTIFKYFHQHKNKEARILSNSSTVVNTVLFPENWDIKWPQFYDDVTSFVPGAKGQHDDAPDVLTGIVESKSNDWVSSY